MNNVYTGVRCGLVFNKFDKERENFYAESYKKEADAKALSQYRP